MLYLDNDVGGGSSKKEQQKTASNGDAAIGSYSEIDHHIGTDGGKEESLCCVAYTQIKHTHNGSCWHLAFNEIPTVGQSTDNLLLLLPWSRGHISISGPVHYVTPAGHVCPIVVWRRFSDDVLHTCV